MVRDQRESNFTRDREQMKSARVEYPTAWVYVTYPEGLVALIAGVLLLNPQITYSKKKLAEQTGVSRQTVQKHLKKLVELNIVSENDSNEPPTYQVNPRTSVSRAVIALDSAIQSVRGEEDDQFSGWLSLTGDRGPVMMVDAIMDAGDRELNKSQWADFAGLRRKTVTRHVQTLVDLEIVSEIRYDDRRRYRFNDDTAVSSAIVELESSVRSSSFSDRLSSDEDAGDIESRTGVSNIGNGNQTLGSFLWRATKLYPDTEIVSRNHDGMQRYTYPAYADRVAQLAYALDDVGVKEGDRVATFSWNTSRHFETYFSVPSIGAQLHTINPLLPDEHIQYIVGNAEDVLVFVDPSLLSKLEGAAADAVEFEGVDFVVMGQEVPDTALESVCAYESFIEGKPTEYDWPALDEEQPAGMCYTSGTTGRPKGVEYTHQMLWSHTMATLTPQGIPMADDDVVMPVVPMFHVNAWGMPFTATAGGAKHVYPGPSPDREDIANLIESEGVTITAGIPTIWLGLMDYMEDNEVDLSALDTVIVGGSAAPEVIIRWFDDHDVELLHAWGMTEMSPLGSVSHLKSDLQDADYEMQIAKRKKQGLMVPGLEFRIVDDDGEDIAWDGKEFGELWVRGPWVTQEYFERPEANEEEFEDGYLKTGDIVSVDPDGYIKIVDRAKDVIKSGGEWISSVELENAIMAHDDIAEATVIGVPHEKWQERPVAFVVPVSDTDETVLREEIYDLLRKDYPKWWLPDDIEFTDELPKTATGKFDKKTLRDQVSKSSSTDWAVGDSIYR